jgi:hypothetical protein
MDPTPITRYSLFIPLHGCSNDRSTLSCAEEGLRNLLTHHDRRINESLLPPFFPRLAGG